MECFWDNTIFYLTSKYNRAEGVAALAEGVWGPAHSPRFPRAHRPLQDAVGKPPLQPPGLPTRNTAQGKEDAAQSPRNSLAGKPSISKSHGSSDSQGAGTGKHSFSFLTIRVPVSFPLTGVGLRTRSSPPFSWISFCFLLWSCSVSVPFSALGVFPTDNWKGGNLLWPPFSSPTRAERAKCSQGLCQPLPRTGCCWSNMRFFKVADFIPEWWKSCLGKGSDLATQS